MILSAGFCSSAIGSSGTMGAGLLLLVLAAFCTWAFSSFVSSGSSVAAADTASPPDCEMALRALSAGDTGFLIGDLSPRLGGAPPGMAGPSFLPLELPSLEGPSELGSLLLSSFSLLSLFSLFSLALSSAFFSSSVLSSSVCSSLSFLISSFLMSSFFVGSVKSPLFAILSIIFCFCSAVSGDAFGDAFGSLLLLVASLVSLLLLLLLLLTS
mmetsp:Transcript_20812/g.46120  ORF Transcript_20812/g.46120 Transcript_20812/m.46120 type:complete len:212 (-) Transcript_20812:531-1166(-)